MEQISLEKEKRYQVTFLPHLKLIEGLPAFLDKAKRQNIALAIGAAAIRYIVFVLDNLSVRGYFKVIVSADDVTK